MFKLMKRVSVMSAIMAFLFMIVQVLADLYLPNLTSDIINNGIAKGDIDYIWHTGFVMIGFSLISIVAAICNTYFATRESQKLGTASLITRTTNDVNQIQLVAQMFLRMMINAPITLVGASFLAYRKDAELTKIFLFVIPIVVVFIALLMIFAVPLLTHYQIFFQYNQ